MLNDLPLNKGLRASLEKLGLEKATDVQEQVIPLALEKRDLLVSAQTGSGKTFAFLIPTLHRLLSETPAPAAGTRVLILSPTRELARQIFKQCRLLTGNTTILSGLIIGGEEFKFQQAVFRKNPEIIIATPGRLLEHLEKASPDFKALEVLILDEADRMLDLGFSEDVLKIATYCRPERQTMLFSATLHQTGLKHMAQQLLNNPYSVSLNADREQNNDIAQQIIFADDKEHKEKLLIWLLENQPFTKVVVFTNTRIQADRLGGLVRYKKLHAHALHSDVNQNERKRILEQFREAKFTVLIASDVAARGLDIQDVDLIINFDMPRSGDDYTHRIGRTGRAGEQGLAISLVCPTEFNLMSSIERYLKATFKRRVIKELKARYSGPKKLKSSGKAVGAKKKKPKDGDAKAKGRLRAKKNTGNRRAPSTIARAESADGFAPLKKKT